MSDTPTSTIEALPEEERLALEQEALAAELTPDEHEQAACLVAGGMPVEDAVLQVYGAREESEAATGDDREAAPPPPSEQELEAIFGRLEKQAAKHREKVADLAGPLLGDLAPCPLCQPQAPGFYLPHVPEPEASQRAAYVAEVLTGASAPDYQDAKTVERCDDCDGWGVVRSGSRAPEHRTVPCPTCSGTGHKAKVAPPPSAPAPPEWQPPPQPTATDGAVQAGAVDQWGRPSGHPHFGILPALVGA